MKRFFIVALLLLFAGNVFAAAINPNRPYSPGHIAGLQDDFDKLTTKLDGTHVDALNDQSDVAIWTGTDLNQSSYLVRFDGTTTLRSELFVYQFGNHNNIYQVSDFMNNAISEYTFGINDAGDLYVNGSLAQANFGNAFGFAVYSNNEGAYSYTEDSLNNGAVRALAYLLDDGTRVTTNYLGGSTAKAEGDDWLLAFETTSGYDDFDDNIFYVEDIAPVPEPATLLLLGSGLVGLAFLKRRKA